MPALASALVVGALGASTLPDLAGIHSTAGQHGEVFGRGFDPAYGEARAPIFDFRFTGGASSNFNTWTQPDTERVYRIPDGVYIYDIPGKSSTDKLQQFDNFSSYVNWTASFHESSLFLLFFNDLRASLDVYMESVLNDTDRVALLQPRLGTSYKVDLWEPSTLREAMKPQGNQSHTPFAVEQHALPADRSTPANRAAYSNFVSKFGTHFVHSFLGGWNVVTWASMLKSDVEKMTESFTFEASVSLLFIFFALDLDISVATEEKFNFTRNFTDAVSYGVVAYGGDPTLLPAGDYAPWLNSTIRNPCAHAARAASADEDDSLPHPP
jgi:hypothetical protein